MTVRWASLLIALLLCATAPPAAAAPWDGIVGFLQTVARLRDLRPNEPSSAEAKPLRKIVYAVEEQITLADPTPAASRVVFDSAALANQTTSDLEKPLRLRRSSNNVTVNNDVELANGTTHHGKGRATSTVHHPIFIGRKLWYAPLWFSLYLMVYMLVLAVKSVVRHRIRYPTLVPADSKSGRRRGDYSRLNGLTNGIENALTAASRQYRYGWQ